MKKIVHLADSRGKLDHGWLKTAHSFSFANWYEPTRMGFGALRVLNDDTIAPDDGFPDHFHANMEIITIPLSGTLKHGDSTGQDRAISPGEVQIMSAGTGIVHHEFNASMTEPISLLQLWIEPSEQAVTPRYDQKTFEPSLWKNKIFPVVSSISEQDGLWIHQNATLSLARMDVGQPLDYRLRNAKNGVYLFVIEGEISVDGETLVARDAIGLWETDSFDVKINKDSYLLFVEVPMI